MRTGTVVYAILLLCFGGTLAQSTGECLILYQNNNYRVSTPIF